MTKSASPGLQMKKGTLSGRLLQTRDLEWYQAGTDTDGSPASAIASSDSS